MAENDFDESEARLKKRMRILDLDSVPAAVLHHSFMFLLVKHLPAEICMKVISRIATYRDTHTQLAYENLIRDLGILLTKHYENCTAIPHSLGPAFVAYLSRILQTISIAWSVDYIRRYGCFSKAFIAQQIERSTTPRLFDCVRYERHGGVKPLPPIITHPHRLSSYVRLLDESSAKFYMYMHLKRHGQIPIQQQLQHQIDAQERLEGGETGPNVLCSQSSREHGACTTRQQGSAISALSATSGADESNEVERGLPRPFIAAEKMLQRGGMMRSSCSCVSGTDSGKVQSGGRQAGKRGKVAPVAELKNGVHELAGDRGLQQRDDRNSRNETVALKRPEMYDLILAAEHLGLDYRQLVNRAVSEIPLGSEKIHETAVEREAVDWAVDGEEVHVWSEDEEHPDETELREMLVDDEKIYYHMLHRYVRRSSGFAQGAGSAPGDEDGDAEETHEDKVISEPQEWRSENGEGAREEAQEFFQKKRVIRTTCPAPAPAKGGAAQYLLAPAPPGISANVLTDLGSVCEAVEVENADGARSGCSQSLEMKRVDHSCVRLTAKRAEADYISCTQVTIAAGAPAEAPAAAGDCDSQKQGNFPTLSHSSFFNGSAVPYLNNDDPAMHSKAVVVKSMYNDKFGNVRTEILTTGGQEIHKNAGGPVETHPVFSTTSSSVTETKMAGRTNEGAQQPAACFSGPSTVERHAAFRMQNTLVAPPTWTNCPKHIMGGEDKTDRATKDALLPCTRGQREGAQWDWKWAFAVDKVDASSTRNHIEEEGCGATDAAKERWWGTSWGRNRAFFRFKGNAYALLPGQGWKRVKGQSQRLLKPRKRNRRHGLKRERHVERKVRLRRVREEILRRQVQAEG